MATIDLQKFVADTIACGRGDQAACARIQEIQKQIDAMNPHGAWLRDVYYPTLVPSNALELSPCLSNEAWKAQYRGAPMPLSAVLDKWGCRVDPITGFRLPLDCFSGGVRHPEGTLCGDRTIHDLPAEAYPEWYKALDRAQKIKAVKIGLFVVKAIIKIVPVIGEMTSAALGQIMDAITAAFGETTTSFVVEELSAILDKIEAAMKEVLRLVGQVRVQLDQAAKNFIKTIQRLTVESRLFANAIRSARASVEKADPQTIMSYACMREALSFASNLAKGDLKSLGALQYLGLFKIYEVRDYATAVEWINTKMAVATTQKTIDLVSERYSGVGRGLLDDLVEGSFPEVNERIVRDGPSGIGLDLSQTLASRYAGQGEKILENFSLARVSSLIPDAGARFAFLDQANMVEGLDIALSPFISEARAAFARGMVTIERYFADAKVLRTGAFTAAKRDQIFALQARARDKLRETVGEANQIVQRGVSLYRIPSERGYG